MEIGNQNHLVRNQFAARDTLYNRKEQKADGFGEALEHAEEVEQGRKNGESAEADGYGASEEDYRAFLLEKMAQMHANIMKGTIQPKIQIGSEAYTQEEWKKLLEKIDAAEDVLREQIEAEIAAAKEEAASEEEESDTTIITRADGARIMIITTPFGEMSIELTKPDDSVAFGDMIKETDPDGLAESDLIDFICEKS